MALMAVTFKSSKTIIKMFCFSDAFSWLREKKNMELRMKNDLIIVIVVVPVDD